MNFRLSSGLTLHYRTRGAGRTILLMHPVGLQGEFWDPAVARLQDDYRLIAVDTRGHGRSAASADPFELDDLARDMGEFLRAMGGGEPAIVAGCSMGGMIAQGIAIHAPDCVAGVVVANATHRRNDASRATMEQRAKAALQGMPAIAEVTLQRWFDDAEIASGSDQVATVRRWLLSADPVIHSRSWMAIRNLSFGDRLGSVTAPALVVAGAQDKSIPVAAVRAVAEDFANASFHEIAGGHLLPYERPDDFAALVKNFAQSIL